MLTKKCRNGKKKKNLYSHMIVKSWLSERLIKLMRQPWDGLKESWVWNNQYNEW